MNKALLTGWSKLVSGNAASGLLQLLGFAIAAQALGAEVLGIIVLIEAYVRFVDGVFNFQSVHVLTRFLAEADHRHDGSRFRGLVKAGFLIDLVTALVACALALAALPLFGKLVGIPEEWIGLAMVYALVIVTRILGVTEAVLRCFDRFWAIGLRGALAGLIIVSGSALAWQFDAGAGAFLMIWFAAELVANIAFFAWAYWVLRENDIVDIRNSGAIAAIRMSPGFWGILWQANLTFGIRLLKTEGDTLLAGAILGPAAAAILRAARRVAAVLAQFGPPLQQVASAPIARLRASGEYRAMLRYAGGICLASGFVGALLTILTMNFGDTLIIALYGAGYEASEPVLNILMLSVTSFLLAITVIPTLIALGRGADFLVAISLAGVAFVLVAATLIMPLGVLGIAWAHVAFDVVWAVSAWAFVMRSVIIREKKAELV